MTKSIDNHDYYNIYYCCITSTQDGKSPLDLARDEHYFNTQEVIEILEAHEDKPEAQTK